MPVAMGAQEWVQNLWGAPSGPPVVNQARSFWRWASEPTSVALRRSTVTGMHEAWRMTKHATGIDYMVRSLQHTTTSLASGRNLLGQISRGAGLRPAEGWWARWMPQTRRIGSAAGVAVMGLMGPGFVIGMGATSEHGPAVGIASEAAGMIVGGLTWAPSLAAGKLIGRRMGARVGGTIAKSIPFLRHIPGATFGATRLGYAIGALTGTLGGALSTFLWWDAARWAVGFALGTFPTFSRQFRQDMEREGFGGDYTDTAGAATMRARSLQVMGKSFANARSALGQEASLMHV